MDVEVGDYLYKFKITYISDQKMYLVQEAEDFVIKIYRKTNKIEARMDNLILNVQCAKETLWKKINKIQTLQTYFTKRKHYYDNIMRNVCTDQFCSAKVCHMCKIGRFLC